MPNELTFELEMTDMLPQLVGIVQTSTSAAGAGLIWRQVDARPEKLAVIKYKLDASKTFVAGVQKQTGLKNTMAREFSPHSASTPDAANNS